ncbi:MAG: pyrroline-5-carboxylate reductase [Deltaproteobacteria bacterium]|nr:pyrroline-5-carboxylate reductase [Deltaproteobacteria bacterium]
MKKTSIIGCGNIGTAIAKGFIKSGRGNSDNLILTARSENSVKKLSDLGFNAVNDNHHAIKNSEIVIIAVTPQQMDDLLISIKDSIDPEKHLVLSVVSGVSCATISEKLCCEMDVIRVMPNTAAAICESMTCISHDGASESSVSEAVRLFDSLGETIILPENMMVPATVLCACGTAFFLRAIRAASQGGIEIGFHPDQAIPIAAQVAKGASALLTSSENHPETEIDKVTTPRGSTITGLNVMEHQGFSSAMIQGILASFRKTMEIYGSDKKK